MIKNITKKVAGLILGTAMILGIGVSLGSTHGEAIGARATDVAYTLSFTKNTSASAYSSQYDITCNNVKWSVPGNMTLGDYTKIGGKLSSATTRNIYSTSSIAVNIGKIIVYSQSKDTQITMESLVVKGYKTSEDAKSGSSSPVFEKTIATYSNTMTFDSITGQENLFYRFECTMTSSATSKNYGIIIDKIEFYEASNPDAHSVTITSEENNIELKDGNTLTMTASCAQGDNVKWYSGNENIATIDESTGILTPIRVGSVVITAACSTDSSATATKTITVWKEPDLVTNKTIAELVDSNADNTILYELTGYVSGLDTSKTAGVFYLSDTKDGESKLKVYGATSTESALSFNINGTYEYVKKYTFFDNDTTKDIINGQKITIKGFTYTYNSELQFNGVITNVEPLVTDVTISPTDDVLLGVNCTQEFTIRITGTYLTDNETVKLSYEELGEDGSVTLLNASGDVIDLDNDTFKDGDKITVKALKEGGYGALTITSVEDSSIYATTGTIETESNAPRLTKLSINPSITTITNLQVGETREYSVSFEGKYLDDTATVTVEYADYLDEKAIIILDANGNETIDNTLEVKNGGTFKIKGSLISEGELTIAPSAGISLEGCESISIETTTINTIVPTYLEVSGTLTKNEFIVGESFDPTGLKLTATYNDSTTKVVTDKVTWSIDKFTKVGENTITATYKETTYAGEKEVSTSIKVNVIEDYIVDVDFDLTNVKTEYNIGDTFVASESGVSATATYKVSETPLTLNAEDLTYDCETFTLGGKQTINVSYTVGENTFKDSYTVNVISQEISATVEGDQKYHLVTDTSELQAGDKFIIASNDTLSALGAFNSDYYDIEDFTFEDSNTKKIVPSITSDTTVFTLGGKEGAWTFRDQDNNYVQSTAKKKMSLSNTSTQTWSISINNNDAKIKPSTTTVMYLFLNVSASRYTTYDKTAETNNELFPQIYKLDETTVTTHSCSLALINFVDSIYSGDDPLLSCDPQGINSTIKWAEITEEFKKLSLETAEIDILKTADVNANGNDVEKFLHDYDYILVKYASKGYEDFLGRNPKQKESSSNKNYLDNNNSPVMAVVIISFVGITAIGGYLFIRKQKQY